jgi:hypothetical protein
MTTPQDERAPLAPRFPGLALLLFPLLFFAAAVQYQRGVRPEPGAHPEPPREAPSGLVPGWTGFLETAAGARVRVRLSRLHSEAEWQAFDARSLARRLALEPGEPWRLEITHDGPAGAPALGLGELSLADAEGVAAHSLSGAPAAAPGAVLDPLWGALAGPSSLEPGETARLCLWGRVPVGAAQLEGSFGALKLFAEAVPIGDDGAALASLEEAP